MTCKEIAAVLEEIAVLLELSGENPFKSRSYTNVARQILQSSEDIAALARNIAVVATYWLNFQSVRASPSAAPDESSNLGLGVYQVLSLVAPFLNDEARRLLQQISREYL